YAAFGVPLPSGALQTMLGEAMNQNYIRPGLDLEKQKGYIPEDANRGCCGTNRGSASTLLEYGIADFALSRYAATQGDPTHAATLLARAQNWRNILIPANKLLSARYANGSFPSITATTYGDPGYLEGSAAQYRWLVPFNQKGLATAQGGNATVNALLDHFFSQI